MRNDIIQNTIVIILNVLWALQLTKRTGQTVANQPFALLPGILQFCQVTIILLSEKKREGPTITLGCEVRINSACTIIQSDQSFACPHQHSINPDYL